MSARSKFSTTLTHHRGGYVFPTSNRAEQPLSDMAMLELVRGLRPGLTVHGFRSTFPRLGPAETTAWPNPRRRDGARTQRRRRSREGISARRICLRSAAS